jgi:hypothetical protein
VTAVAAHFDMEGEGRGKEFAPSTPELLRSII